jgi:hypothetical protein
MDGILGTVTIGQRKILTKRGDAVPLSGFFVGENRTRQVPKVHHLYYNEPGL